MGVCPRKGGFMTSTDVERAIEIANNIQKGEIGRFPLELSICISSDEHLGRALEAALEEAEFSFTVEYPYIHIY